MKCMTKWNGHVDANEKLELGSALNGSTKLGYDSWETVKVIFIEIGTS